jgi:subtilisin family serine protease
MHARRLLLVSLILAGFLGALASPAVLAASDAGPVIVYLKAPATAEQLAALQAKGFNVGVAYRHLPAVSGNLPQGRIAAVSALDFVVRVAPDTIRTLHAIGHSRDGDFEPPIPIANTYNLDFIDREKTDATGTGAYVAILDSGLVPNWRDYLDTSRVRYDLGRAFTGASGNPVPDMLARDRNGHGTATSATVIGYRLWDKSETGQFFPQPATGTPGVYSVPGVAPGAMIIPIRVCDVGVYCWDSSIFSGLDYVVSLKAGEAANGDLKGAPIVVNLSLGGPSSSPEEEAVYRAVTDAGVLVVASAGNSGDAGMGWPGAYPVVISVAAGGWRKQFYGAETALNNQWWMDDVPEEDASVAEWFVVWWSSREYANRGQELDVTATGRFMLLPYLWSGKAVVLADPEPADGIPSEYTYISGTSFSAPTTAGVVALMLSVNPALTQAEAEAILRATALPLPADSWVAGFPFPAENEWDASKSLGGSGTKTGWGLVQADGAVSAARA